MVFIQGDLWQKRHQALQIPFVKISVEDRAEDLLDRFSVEAAVQNPFVRLSVQGVYKRSPKKISWTNHNQDENSCKIIPKKNPAPLCNRIWKPKPRCDYQLPASCHPLQFCNHELRLSWNPWNITKFARKCRVDGTTCSPLIVEGGTIQLRFASPRTGSKSKNGKHPRDGSFLHYSVRALKIDVGLFHWGSPSQLKTWWVQVKQWKNGGPKSKEVSFIKRLRGSGSKS